MIGLGSDKNNNQLDFYHWCLRLFTCFWSSHQAIAFSTCFLRWSNLKWNDWIYEASCVSYHGKHIFRIKANNIQVMFTTYSLHGLIRLRALSAKSWRKKDMAMTFYFGMGNILNLATWNEQQMVVNEMSVKNRSLPEILKGQKILPQVL